VRYGVLANGMRYALMKNQLPPGAVSIRFDLKFGSLYEADGEQGLAHVIEHMAFNGSRHVAEGEMVRRHVERREPLVVELEAFARAVRDGGPPPVDPHEAMVALLLARTMVEAASTGAVISGAQLEAVLA